MKCEERTSIVTRSCRITHTIVYYSLIGYNRVIFGGAISHNFLTQSPIPELDTVHYLVFDGST